MGVGRFLFSHVIDGLQSSRASWIAPSTPTISVSPWSFRGGQEAACFSSHCAAVAVFAPQTASLVPCWWSCKSLLQTTGPWRCKVRPHNLNVSRNEDLPFTAHCVHVVGSAPQCAIP